MEISLGELLFLRGFLAGAHNVPEGLLARFDEQIKLERATGDSPIRATRENYVVTMNTRIRRENNLGNVPNFPCHLPSFEINACSPGEAIIKVRAMFGDELRIAGSVTRAAPHYDREMDFDE